MTGERRVSVGGGNKHRDLDRICLVDAVSGGSHMQAAAPPADGRLKHNKPIALAYRACINRHAKRMPNVQTNSVDSCEAVLTPARTVVSTWSARPCVPFRGYHPWQRAGRMLANAANACSA